MTSCPGGDMRNKRYTTPPKSLTLINKKHKRFRQKPTSSKWPLDVLTDNGKRALLGYFELYSGLLPVDLH